MDSDKGALSSGTFVEIGAYDGITFSNTLVYERELGWTGLLIEGCPSSADALKRNRRGNTTNLNKAVCSASQFPRTIKFSANCDASSGIAGHGDEFLQNKHRSHRKVSVPCAPMSEIFRENSVTHIDLFSIDVEGYELPLLRTINWNELSVRVLLIEVNHNSPQELQQIRSLLLSVALVSHGLCGTHYGDEIWFNSSYCRPGGDKWVPVTWKYPEKTVSNEWRLRPCEAVHPNKVREIRKRDIGEDMTEFSQYVISFQRMQGCTFYGARNSS